MPRPRRRRRATFSPVQSFQQKTPYVGPNQGWKPAAPTPQPTATPAPQATAQGLPLDPQYDLTVGSALANYQNQQANLQYAGQRLGQEYGFSDTSNPFNRAAMLQRAYQQGQQGRTNRMAAGGQLYSGATQRGLDEGTFGYQRSYDVMKREFEDRQRALQESGVQAGLDYQSAISQAYGDRIGRALEQRPEDPGAPAQPAAVGAPTGGWAGPGQKFKPLKPKKKGNKTIHYARPKGRRRFG